MRAHAHPICGYQALNVEAQQRQAHALHWRRRTI
jgi:hypothetical protein